MSTTSHESSASLSDNLTRAGAYLGLLASLALLGYGVQALHSSAHPLVLCTALLVTGALEAALCWYTLRGRRAAWAFACTLNGTLVVVFLFAAPTLRDALGIGLLPGFIPFFVFMVIAGLLSLGSQSQGSREQ